MPRFSVAFGKRKSTANDGSQDGQIPGPSFRVLERTEVSGGKSFDGGARLSRVAEGPLPKSYTQPVLRVEDNMFADLKMNRGSGSSNTTKTASTDTSSRHSGASTAPSSSSPPSTDTGLADESRQPAKKAYTDIPVPPIPKSSSGFLNRAGRTFSFGGQKKGLPLMAPQDVPSPPPIPKEQAEMLDSRPRSLTTSTVSTATPPKLEEDFSMDMGGDFGTMFTGLDKRASVATVRDDPSRAGRSLTGSRLHQPPPMHLDKTSKVEASPYSWTSQNSNDGLLGGSSPSYSSPSFDLPPAVPRHASPLGHKGNRPSDIIEDEDAGLLKDSLMASKFLANPNSSQTSRHRKDADSYSFSRDIQRKPVRHDAISGQDNLFDTNLINSSRIADRYVARAPSPPRNRVMTPAQFEKYKQDKERGVVKDSTQPSNEKDEEEEDNYEDDEDDEEKSKQAASQRRKQEAKMTVYRQRMMKITGEGSNSTSRPVLPTSLSAPILGSNTAPLAGGGSDGSDEDEEVPLGVLMAHGFPNKNRPPTRLSTIASNPNIRASVLPPAQPTRAGSSMGDHSGAGARASHLPAFARNLPQDPFVGAGLVKQSTRESLAFGGGAPPTIPQLSTMSSGAQGPVPPGGLVGVIANEERSRAMRRGSPQVDSGTLLQGGFNWKANQGYDPITGIPPHMMYSMGGSPSMPHLSPMGPMAPAAPLPQMLTPGDQAQFQMTQQMQQFMQMQMQFMQMMAMNNGQGAHLPGHMASHSMGEISSRQSVMGEPAMEPPRLDARMRTMSMVQPSSASWIQPQGYAPSIRIQGDGYAPSIAPSERSTVGLPGRYRPVSQAPPPLPVQMRRVSTMSGPMGWEETGKSKQAPKSGSDSDDDEEEGWEAMKARREKKRSVWKSKKTLGVDFGSLIR